MNKKKDNYFEHNGMEVFWSCSRAACLPKAQASLPAGRQGRRSCSLASLAGLECPEPAGYQGQATGCRLQGGDPSTPSYLPEL